MKKRYYKIISFALAFLLAFTSADISVLAETLNEGTELDVEVEQEIEIESDGEAEQDTETESDDEAEQDTEIESDEESEQEIEIESDGEAEPDIENESDAVDTDNAEYPTPALNYHLVEGEGEYESLNENLGDFGLYALDRAVTYPAKFNPVEEANYLPALRNQNPYGSCWAHSIIAAGEIEYAKNNPDDISVKKHNNKIDLSELQLAYFMYNSPATDPLGLSVGDWNKAADNDFLNVGGSVEYAKRIMQGWIGAADDSGVLAYSNASSVLSTGLAADPYAYNSDLLHLQNYYNINIDERDDVKQAIEDYGAVTVSYFDAAKYYKSGKDNNGNSYASFYCSSSMGTNHAVVIVGWDDDFSKYNFATTPEGDGAWLIRNSWNYSGTATYSRYNYFWISYYDKSLNGGISVEMEPADNYDNNYHYDGSAYDMNYLLPSGSKVANVFTAKANAQGETLRAVSFETKSANVIYDIDIYTGLANTSNPESGTLVSSIKDGVTAYSGYYTVNLDEPVALDEGETFSVVITFSLADGGKVKIPVENSYPGSDWFSAQASSNAGESFYRLKSNSKWTDKGSEGTGNFRIKAFTDNYVHMTVSFDSNGGEPEFFSSIEEAEKGRTYGSYGSLPVPARTGYTFDGWYTKLTGGTKITGSTRISKTKDHTLYAHWTPKKYTVTFDGNGSTSGSMPVLLCVYETNKALKANAFKRKGYTFAGWSLDEGAVYDAQATYLRNGEKVTGFLDADGEFVEDVTLYAVWKPVVYKITYRNIPSIVAGTEDCIKDGTEKPAAYTTESSFTLAQYIPEKLPGYTFGGWYTSSSFKDSSRIENITPGRTGNITLYAKFTASPYIIKFNKNASNATSVRSMNDLKCVYGTGKKLTANIYSRKGYKFAGWSLKEGAVYESGTTYIKNGAKVTGFLEDNKLMETVNLYAVWKPIEYKITYKNAVPGKSGVTKNDNPSTFTVENVQITAKASDPAVDNEIVLKNPERTGYTFDGWYTDSKYKKPFEIHDAATRKPLTIYAKWIK